MIDETDSPAGLSPETSGGSKVLAELMDEDSVIWKDVPRIDDNQQSSHLRSWARYKILEGRSDTGASIVAARVDFQRQELRTILDNPGTSYVSSHEEWQLAEIKDGVEIGITTQTEHGERRVYIYLPDRAQPGDTYQQPLEIRSKDFSGSRVLSSTKESEAADFRRALAEIEYFLDDKVSWEPVEAHSPEDERFRDAFDRLIAK